MQRAGQNLALSRKNENVLEVVEIASLLKGEFKVKATIAAPGRISMIAPSESDRVACIFASSGVWKLGLWVNSGNKFVKEVETGGLLVIYN